MARVSYRRASTFQQRCKGTIAIASACRAGYEHLPACVYIRVQLASARLHLLAEERAQGTCRVKVGKL